MNFESALRSQLEADPNLRRRGRRILAVLNDNPSARRTKRLARLEAHARAHYGVGLGAIDWSQIINSENIKALMDLLIAVLPLILKLFV